MDRRNFLTRTVSVLGALCAGTLVFGSKRTDGAVITIDRKRFRLPDWASPDGRSYALTDSCVNQCNRQCGTMCAEQCVVAMCDDMCGSNCHEQCAAQCTIMCGGGVQFCVVTQCGDMCVLEHGCLAMNCKDGTTEGALLGLTALRAFEFRFNMATLKPQYIAQRPMLIHEFYDKFSKSGSRSKVFPELERIRSLQK